MKKIYLLQANTKIIKAVKIVLHDKPICKERLVRYNQAVDLLQSQDFSIEEMVVVERFNSIEEKLAFIHGHDTALQHFRNFEQFLYLSKYEYEFLKDKISDLHF